MVNFPCFFLTHTGNECGFFLRWAFSLEQSLQTFVFLMSISMDKETLWQTVQDL